MIYCAGHVDVVVRVEIGVVPGLRVIEMNAYGRRCTGKVSRHKRTEHVVDSAPAISGSVPSGHETLNFSIRLDDRTVYPDDPSERRIGYRSNKDATRPLSHSTL